jgi:hypothetical protein
MALDLRQKLCRHQELKPIVDLAVQLHSGVKYGQSDMLDHVLRVADTVYMATGGDLRLTKAALVHKAFEGKRINGGKALSLEAVEDLVGEGPALAAFELQSYDDKTDKGTRTDKVDGAKHLGRDAKVILMAEKIVNFRTSIDSPNPDKPFEWHVNYFQSRIDIARAGKNAHAGLADVLEKTYNEGIEALTRHVERHVGRKAAPTA